MGSMLTNYAKLKQFGARWSSSQITSQSATSCVFISIVLHHTSTFAIVSLPHQWAWTTFILAQHQFPDCVLARLKANLMRTRDCVIKPAIFYLNVWSCGGHINRSFIAAKNLRQRETVRRRNGEIRDHNRTCSKSSSSSVSFPPRSSSVLSDTGSCVRCLPRKGILLSG